MPTRSTVRFVLLGLSVAPGLLAQPEEPWRILVLNTADFFNPSSVAQEQAMRASFTERAGRSVEFHSETLDAVSFDISDYEPEIVALLGKKYRDLRMDLVMALGNEALLFAESHRDEMWPSAPIVFFSVSKDAFRNRPRGPGVTGITIEFDEPGTLALALRLQPAARRVVLIAGASDYDRSWVPRLRAAVAHYAGRVEPTFLVGEPLPAVLREVARLPRDTVVLYTTISRDGAGQPYVPRNVAEEISRASSAPVYGMIEAQVGYGIVGGSVPGFTAQGRGVAALALRVLGGEKADAIAIQSPPAPVAMVDWRQLRRWGLSEERLPPGSVTLFREPSFWEEYRGYIAAAALVLAVQTALIVALLVQRRRRRLAEMEAQRQRAELFHAARLSAVGQLTASIAHEINQPLGAILSNAEAAEMLLQGRPSDLEPVRQILADIRSEDLRASDVIQRVRGLLTKHPPAMGRLDLNDVAGDVLHLLAGDAQRRAILLEARLAPGLPPVRGDRVQLQQVLLNLVLNGMEAMADSSEERRRIVVETRSDGNSGVEVAVRDTGPGIDPALGSRLFDSFFTTKATGMGLGLSISRSIVEAHGGRLGAVNNPEGGATFRLVLPASPDPDVRPAGGV